MQAIEIVDKTSEQMSDEITAVIKGQDAKDALCALCDNMLSWFITFNEEKDVLDSFDEFNVFARNLLVEYLKGTSSEPVREVVKIQKPIAPQGAPYLVYNENRTREMYIEEKDLPENVRSVFVGGVLRAYFLAEWVNDNWRIIEQTEDQDW